MNDTSRLKQVFEENFERYGELGASVSLWQNGQEIISINKGWTSVDHSQNWTSKSLVPVFSATKGAASAAFLLALYRAGHTPLMEAGELWPMFPLPDATLAQVLSHQCGLAKLARPADLFDHEDCVKAIEMTSPAWEPPSHGYHPHTFGPILDELMLRLTGETIASWWEREIRQPLDLDFYLTLPEEEFDRVATLYPAKADKEELSTPFYKQYLQPGSDIFNAFHSLTGLGSVRSMNTPKAWTCGSPALGGVASARGMAMFYQACLGCTTELFPPLVRQWMTANVINGPDQTLMTPTAFTCGFMQDPFDTATHTPLRMLFGGTGFGHAGAGGSHAFGLPSSGLSFAYAMNNMDLSVLPGKKTQRLVNTLPLYSPPSA